MSTKYGKEEKPLPSAFLVEPEVLWHGIALWPVWVSCIPSCLLTHPRLPGAEGEKGTGRP